MYQLPPHLQRQHQTTQVQVIRRDKVIYKRTFQFHPPLQEIVETIITEILKKWMQEDMPEFPMKNNGDIVYLIFLLC